MTFSTTVNKWANSYFFLQNLSEWHFSNRKEYNLAWRKELGVFSQIEERAILQFKEIHSRYPFGKNYLGRPFFTSESPFEELKTVLSKEDFTEIEKIFSLFSDKFELFWEKEKLLLQKWEEVLNTTINNQASNTPIIETLSTLYHTGPTQQHVKIYLLPSLQNRTGGGASVSRDCISIEISRYPLEGAAHTMGIIWHEVIHTSFDKAYFHPLLREITEEKFWSPITEIAASSLFPRGVLGEQYFKLSHGNTLHNMLVGLNSEKILDITRQYIREKKCFDKDYINTIHQMLVEKNSHPNF